MEEKYFVFYADSFGDDSWSEFETKEDMKHFLNSGRNWMTEVLEIIQGVSIKDAILDALIEDK